MFSLKPYVKLATHEQNSLYYNFLVLFKDDDKFDEEGALDSLVETYGKEKVSIKAYEEENKKRKVKIAELPTTEDSDEKVKKTKLSDTFQVSD